MKNFYVILIVVSVVAGLALGYGIWGKDKASLEKLQKVMAENEVSHSRTLAESEELRNISEELRGKISGLETDNHEFKDILKKIDELIGSKVERTATAEPVAEAPAAAASDAVTSEPAPRSALAPESVTDAAPADAAPANAAPANAAPANAAPANAAPANAAPANAAPANAAPVIEEVAPAATLEPEPEAAAEPVAEVPAAAPADAAPADAAPADAAPADAAPADVEPVVVEPAPTLAPAPEANAVLPDDISADAAPVIEEVAPAATPEPEAAASDSESVIDATSTDAAFELKAEPEFTMPPAPDELAPVEVEGAAETTSEAEVEKTDTMPLTPVPELKSEHLPVKDVI